MIRQAPTGRKREGGRATNASQLPLELPLQDSHRRDDLAVGAANALATQMIDAWPDWPGSLLLLVGPAGTGKTHLARIWAERAEALIMDAGALQAGSPAPGRRIVIEDARPGAIDDTMLFATLNHVRAHGGHALITSRLLPGQWGVSLPDLASRLRAAQLARLSEPDDALLGQVIVKLFSDRQLGVDPGVVDYLVARMERSLEAAGRIVAEIDREALARNAGVSKRLAAAALEKLESG